MSFHQPKRSWFYAKETKWHYHNLFNTSHLYIQNPTETNTSNSKLRQAKIARGFEKGFVNSTIYQVTPKRVLPLTNHQTIAFCSITYMYLDSESIFINLDFDTPSSQIR